MPAPIFSGAQAAGTEVLSVYGATSVPAGDWGSWVGAFLPAALLGLAVIWYLVRRLDQSQTENKALSERLISNQEVMAPLLRDAIELIGQQGVMIEEQGDLLREARAEARVIREERDRRDRDA